MTKTRREDRVGPETANTSHDDCPHNTSVQQGGQVNPEERHGNLLIKHRAAADVVRNDALPGSKIERDEPSDQPPSSGSVAEQEPMGPTKR